MKKFSGNIKALQLYIVKNHPHIETKLVSWNRGILKQGHNYNLRTEYFLALSGLWATLRAERIVIDASTSGKFHYGRFSLIQLWHGSGFKNVGLLCQDLKVDNLNARNKKLKAVYSKYDFVAFTSESEAKKQNLSFGTNKAVVTGYPRNDIFFNKELSYPEIKNNLNISNYKKVILYAPRFRDSVSKSSARFTPKFWRKLQNYLEVHNSIFVVNRHPSDIDFKVPGHFKNILDLTEKTSDLQELLLITDVLITDYSSIATDFALTGRPIMINVYDFKSYKQNCRSIYYDLEETVPKPFIKTENELLDKIKDSNWFETPEVKESYQAFRDTLHHYLDGNSSERVLQEIQKL